MPILYEEVGIGIPQHITKYIPPVAGPDAYGGNYVKLGPKSLAIDSTSILVGLVGGFIIGGLVFTAAGRKIGGAAGQRVATYIAPK